MLQAQKNTHKKHKIVPFINLLLIVRLFSSSHKHNSCSFFPHVCYVIQLFLYVYTPTSFQGRFSLQVTKSVCLMSTNRSQLFINQYNALFCVFILETYPSWVSINTFCCGEAYSCINDCLCIVEYKIHITNFNDWNTRICLATRKRLDRHP